MLQPIEWHNALGKWYILEMVKDYKFGVNRTEAICKCGNSKEDGCGVEKKPLVRWLGNRVNPFQDNPSIPLRG